MGRQFPGSWLPFGPGQDARSAEPHFRLAASTNSRLAFTSGVSANSVCFERELLDHYRLVCKKA